MYHRFSSHAFSPAERAALSDNDSWIYNLSPSSSHLKVSTVMPTQEPSINPAGETRGPSVLSDTIGDFLQDLDNDEVASLRAYLIGSQAPQIYQELLNLLPELEDGDEDEDDLDEDEDE